MSEVAELPEWQLQLLSIACAYALYFALAAIIRRRTTARVLSRRANLTEAKFLADMAKSGVTSGVAVFIWGNALLYTKPALTPHPDDLLGDDLMIDDHDWGKDWPALWADRQGIPLSDLADWPEGWPPTVRNFGSWLSTPIA